VFYCIRMLYRPTNQLFVLFNYYNYDYYYYYYYYYYSSTPCNYIVLLRLVNLIIQTLID